MIKASISVLILIFGGIIGKIQASESNYQDLQYNYGSDSGSGSDSLLKSTNTRNDIMNLDSVFDNSDLLKAARGKGKDKKKKKKDESSDSDRSERRHRHTSNNPGKNEPVMRQQEVNYENTERRFDDGSIVVDGPIFRKPFVRPG